MRAVGIWSPVSAFRKCVLLLLFSLPGDTIRCSPWLVRIYPLTGLWIALGMQPWGCLRCNNCLYHTAVRAYMDLWGNTPALKAGGVNALVQIYAQSRPILPSIPHARDRVLAAVISHPLNGGDELRYDSVCGELRRMSLESSGTETTASTPLTTLAVAGS